MERKGDSPSWIHVRRSSHDTRGKLVIHGCGIRRACIDAQSAVVQLAHAQIIVFDDKRYALRVFGSRAQGSAAFDSVDASFKFEVELGIVLPVSSDQAALASD